MNGLHNYLVSSECAAWIYIVCQPLSIQTLYFHTARFFMLATDSLKLNFIHT